MCGRLRRFFAPALLTLLLVTGPLAAHGHPPAVLDAWHDHWESRVAVHGLTVPLLAEWLDMRGRHSPPVFLPVQAHTRGAGVERWRSLVAAYFPAGQVDTALRVMACESGGDPTADNPTSSAAGLFQFIRSTWDWVAGEVGLPSYVEGGPYDPTGAVQAAAWLQANGGWQHWVCY